MATNYTDELHQLSTYEDGCVLETFWSNALGCTVVITFDKDGVRIILVDDNKMVKGAVL